MCYIVDRLCFSTDTSKSTPDHRNQRTSNGNRKPCVFPEIIADHQLNDADKGKSLIDNQFRPAPDNSHQRQTDHGQSVVATAVVAAAAAAADNNFQKTVQQQLEATRQQKVSKFRLPVTTRLQTLRCATPVREKIRQFKQLHELQRLEKLHHSRSIQPSVALAIEISTTEDNVVTCLPTTPPPPDVKSNEASYQKGGGVIHRQSSPTTSWRTWRDVNQSDVYTDVKEYIHTNNLMPDDKRHRIEQWIEQSWNASRSSRTVSRDDERSGQSLAEDTRNELTSAAVEHENVVEHHSAIA